LRFPFPRVIAAAACSVVLFGEVDELKVVREGARDALGGRRIEGTDELAELPGRGSGLFSPSRALARAPILGEGADRLLEVEKALPVLLDERITEDVPQIRDVAPQCVEGVVHALPSCSDSANDAAQPVHGESSGLLLDRHRETLPE